MLGKVRLSVKWSELVARWSSTVASANGMLVKARAIVFSYGFVGISGVLRRLRSFSDAQPAISCPLYRSENQDKAAPGKCDC